jgi:folylpolyglutamate synthase/dihydropteroate synthase
VGNAIKEIVAKEKSCSRILVCGSLYLAGDILKNNK